MKSKTKKNDKTSKKAVKNAKTTGINKELRHRFTELLNDLGGCCLQDGYPCNTCFHHNIKEKLGLDSDMTHLLWLIHLALREGEEAYPSEAIIEANREFFEGLSKKVSE